MIRHEEFVRQRGTREMVRQSYGTMISPEYVLCEVAMCLVRGWKLRVWQRLQPHCEAMVDLVLVDDQIEQRVRFSSREMDLKAIHEMAEHAFHAGSEEARTQMIKKYLLKGCRIEMPDPELVKRLSVQDVGAAALYMSRYPGEFDFGEAHVKEMEEFARFKKKELGA